MKKLLTGIIIMAVPLIGMAQTNITANLQFEDEVATGQYQDWAKQLYGACVDIGSK